MINTVANNIYEPITDYSRRPDFQLYEAEARRQRPNLEGAKIMAVWIVVGPVPGYMIQYLTTTGEAVFAVVTRKDGSMGGGVDDAKLVFTSNVMNNSTSVVENTTAGYQNFTSQASQDMNYQNYVDKIARGMYPELANATIREVFAEFLPSGVRYLTKYLLTNGSIE